jgi:hypothetical protein
VEPTEPKKRGRPRNPTPQFDRKRIKFLGFVADLTQRRDNWTVYIFEESQKEDAPKESFVKYTEAEARDEAMNRIRALVDKKKNPGP